LKEVRKILEKARRRERLLNESDSSHVVGAAVADVFKKIQINQKQSIVL